VDDSLLADGSIAHSFYQATRRFGTCQELQQHERGIAGIATDIQQFYGTKYPRSVPAGELDPSFDCRSSTHLSIHVFSLYESGLAHAPQQHRPLLHAGLFPMSRRTARQLRWQGDPERLQYVPHVQAQLESGAPLIRHEEGVPFKHPVDIGDLTQATCSDCHTGGLDRSDGHDASDQEKHGVPQVCIYS